MRVNVFLENVAYFLGTLIVSYFDPFSLCFLYLFAWSYTYYF